VPKQVNGQVSITQSNKDQDDVFITKMQVNNPLSKKDDLVDEVDERRNEHEHPHQSLDDTISSYMTN